jgi:FixJ family two-component response regulator
MIAIIDDDASIRTAIESFIESYGFPVRSFSSAEDFLVNADFSRLCCVVTDIHMQGMNGLELQKFIKERHSDIPVIMITAFFDDTVRQNAMANGAAGFFVKPFRITDLLRQIELGLPDSERND